MQVALSLFLSTICAIFGKRVCSTNTSQFHLNDVDKSAQGAVRSCFLLHYWRLRAAESVCATITLFLFFVDACGNSTLPFRQSLTVKRRHDSTTMCADGGTCAINR